MGVRKRERIARNDNEKLTCAECGDSMLENWARTIKVDGEYKKVCTTCVSELRE